MKKMTTTSFLNRSLLDGIRLKNFKGTYPCDVIPSITKRNIYETYIINLDEKDMPGSHWVSIAFNKEDDGSRSCFYFDSLAMETVNGNILKYMMKYSDRIYQNDVKIQDDISEYCGLFCMAFVIFTDKNSINDVNKFIQLFTRNNLLTNDEIVVQYIIDEIYENIK